MIQYAISLITSIILGFAIGLERELTNKQAGLRTHIFVCLGSCVFTLLSIYGFPTFASGDNVIISQATGVRDTARIAAQIVTGIGFIGAGTVMKNGSSVHGLTTASTLWIAAAVGMACGTGRFDIAVIASVLSIVVLIFIKWIEKNFLEKRKISKKRLKLTLKCNQCDVNNIQNYIMEEFPYLNEIKKVDSDKEHDAKIVAVISIKDKNPLQTAYKKCEAFNGVTSIAIQEVDE
ncbi:MgtC/SapB family protein [bacterium]|nr:MgtC/SapB family protein [bacterium]